MRKTFLSLFTIISFSAQAQQVRPLTAAQLYSEIAQLKNLANVLYLAAHPDDENTRLLAWLVNDQHIRTAYLSLTRGDGGQNILSNELGPALGLIRTYELLEARKLDGAGQFFTRAVDFGFSKTSDETFKHWNDYLLTHDVVWVMRKFRPDVVICRFPPTAQAGHGQHAASAILAAKAFAASGDKTQYTEHFSRYPAWQPKRLLFNSYRFGERNTTSDDQYKLEVGQYSPLLGMGYGELAGISRSLHRSQGAGTPSTPGVQTEYFKVIAGDSINNSMFDGIDITWGRVNRPEIGKHIQDILDAYDFTNPAKSLPALVKLRDEIGQVKDPYWRAQKLEEVDAIILHATGIMAEAYTRLQPEAVAGATLPVTLRVIARPGNTNVKLQRVQWIGTDTTTNLVLQNDSLYSMERNITLPANAPITEPYWLSQSNSDAGMFSIPHDTLLGLPTTPNNLQVQLELLIAGKPYSLSVPLSYKTLDPLRGDVVEQLRIVPDVVLEFANSLLVTEADGSARTFIRLHPYKNISNASLEISGEKNILKINNLNLRAGNDTTIAVNVPANTGQDDYYLQGMVKAGGKTYFKSQRIISYSHLPTLQYFGQPYTKVLRNDWKVTAKRIGYIEGAGDFAPTFLRLAGLQVDVLKEEDFTNAARLKKYDAIITGIRAVNVEKRMAYWMPVLLEYVQNGGTLVMQYNTLQDMSTGQIGPYPLSLSRNRVTEEDAEVTITAPTHRLLTYPNKITPADFKDWVQERGLYFPTQYDAQYQTIFGMHDAGEENLAGATLYTPYGKGHYIYTSLAFFRQLPAGNKGAIRLLMNMLSIGQ